MDQGLGDAGVDREDVGQLADQAALARLAEGLARVAEALSVSAVKGGEGGEREKVLSNWAVKYLIILT